MRPSRLPLCSALAPAPLRLALPRASATDLLFAPAARPRLALSSVCTELPVRCRARFLCWSFLASVVQRLDRHPERS
jgi:hypothetical protein